MSGRALELVREQLLEALRAAACTNLALLPRGAPAAPGANAASHLARSPGASAATQLVCVAASTGGPAALARVIPLLPRFVRTAVLIVQHMPAGFTASLADRLHRASRLHVREAQQGEPILAGHAYIAPGGFHLRVAGAIGDATLVLDGGVAAWGVRPAADPMFKTVAACAGAASVGVVLTGMGRDGAEGLAAIRRVGGIGVVQHRDSAVIAGMPDAALRLAGADHVAMIDDMAATITSAVMRGESES